MFKNLLLQRNEKIKMNHPYWTPRGDEKHIHDDISSDSNIVTDLKTNLNEQMKYSQELEMKLYQSELHKKKLIRENLEQTKMDILNSLASHDIINNDNISQESNEAESPPKLELEPKINKSRNPIKIKAPIVKRPVKSKE